MVGLLAVLGVVGFCVTPVPFALALPAEEPTAETNRVIAPFELTDFAGVPWRLEETLPQPLVVVFVGIECPIVNLSIDELNRIEQEFGERVSLVLIDSNQQDSLLEMEQFARQHELTMPLLKDPGNKVADSFQATRTPEVFLLDRDRQVRYHGQINDRYTYGFRRDEARHHYLVDAIEALTTDQDISVPSTEPLGCHIGRLLETQADAQVTYCGEVAAILQKHCLKCHRDGEIGPFAMDTYEEVVGWAEMIAEVVEEERMPPWHASPEFGHFSNDSRLTEQEKRILFDWVNAGAPVGDLADLPPAPRFTDGWQISEPDLVVEMAAQPIELPATGEIPYRYFAIDPGFTEDKWIQQAECRAGNRAVVHHIIVAVDPPGDDDRQERRELGEWLCATAPGARPMILPRDTPSVFQRAQTDLPNALHAQRQTGDRLELDRSGICRCGRRDSRGRHRTRHQHRIQNPGGRGQLSRRRLATLPGTDGGHGFVPAYAFAWQVVPLRSDLSRWTYRDVARHSPLRLQLAERLCLRRAVAVPGRHATSLHRPLR
ncbi:MAG: redoxin domain-containing protein [Pirellulaceae bacterium]